jgi:type II secretory pathway pseudopilin PulG
MLVRRSQGFMLMEVLVALVVIGTAAACITRLSSTTVRISDQVGEAQLAAMVGASAMDRLVSRGYAELALAGSGEWPLDGVHSDSSSPGTLTFTPVDGAPAVAGFTTQYTCSALREGLLRLRVRVNWTVRGHKEELELVRYLADITPAVAGEERAS